MNENHVTKDDSPIVWDSNDDDMRIDDVISRLTELRERHGNIICRSFDGDSAYYPDSAPIAVEYMSDNNAVYIGCIE